MSVLVIRGDAARLPLPDASVDLIVSSPPYFALRSYRDDGGHYAGQVGSEATPQAFLEALWTVMAECWRVLKPTGSCFVNLGDKRSGSGGHNNASLQAPGNKHAKAARLSMMDNGQVVDPGKRATRRNAPDRYNQAAFGRPKSKMLLPHRFAIGCEDGLADPEGKGWIVRSDLVWSKKNSLPESCGDRCRDSHEYLFHLVKSPRYFAAIDEIREPVEWSGTSDSCPRCGRSLAVGDGSGASPRPGTGESAGRTAWSSPTAPPMNSLWDLSPTGSSSTTSAVIEDVSDLATWNPSPAERTSPEARPSLPPTSSRPSAATATPSTRPTPTGLPTEAVCAACASEPRTDGATERYPRNNVDQPGPTGSRHTQGHALGSLPGSVWPLASEPLRIPEEHKAHYGLPDHFAAFPTELVRRVILGWSPSGVCVECGEGRRPVVAKELEHVSFSSHAKTKASGGEARTANGRAANNVSRESATITHYACPCWPETPPTRPAAVLDPFSGTGTTAGVARMLGRIGVAVDMSADYCRLARYFIFGSDRFAKALRRTNGERQGAML